MSVNSRDLFCTLCVKGPKKGAEKEDETLKDMDEEAEAERREDSGSLIVRECGL